MAGMGARAIGNVAFSKVGTYVLTLAERPGSRVAADNAEAPQGASAIGKRRHAPVIRVQPHA